MVQGAIEELPSGLQKFLQFEQCQLWNIGRFRHVKGHSSCADWKYLPEHRAVFELPCFRVPKRHLSIYGRQAGYSEGGAPWDREGTALFPVHPSELERSAAFIARSESESAAAEGLRFWASPTSSARTVLVWPEGEPQRAFFAKLSVQSEVIGDRRLEHGVVARSIGLSQLISESRGSLPSALSYFAEARGLVPRGTRDGGVLFRTIPEEILAGTTVVAPFFALMGGSGEHRPLLLQLAESGRFCVQEFLEEVVLRRFARLWVDLVFDFGVILEAHGQDLLLALSPDLVPQGTFYYRDFEGMAIDWALRGAIGLPTPDAPPRAWDWFCTYETWGHRMYQLVSIKLTTSLFDYVDLVLAELEMAIRDWQRKGALWGAGISEGELPFRFSRHLRIAIDEKFGMREVEEYDIREGIYQFVKFLMRVRREAMRVGR